MSANSSSNGGKIWAISIGAGILAFLVLRFMASYGFGPALLLAILIALLVAVLFWIGFYRDGEPESVGDTIAPPMPAEPEKPVRTYTAAEAPAPATTTADDSTPKPEATPAAQLTPAEVPAEKKPTSKPAAKKTAAKPAAKKTASAKASEKKSAAKGAPKAPAKKPVAKDGKPEFLSAPRAGGADDLKMIKGVGPKLEKLLNEMGVYHFDQIAGWRAKEVKWMDENLKGFKGRVSRDEWIKQAKVLAKGGSTEFSKRVKKGGVY